MNKQKDSEITLPTDRPGIYKVGKGILINTDNEALQAYKARKRKMQDIDELKVEMGELRSDISEIKKLLKELIK